MTDTANTLPQLATGVTNLTLEAAVAVPQPRWYYRRFGKGDSSKSAAGQEEDNSFCFAMRVT